jgi:hypothetical protein
MRRKLKKGAMTLRRVFVERLMREGRCGKDELQG